MEINVVDPYFQTLLFGIPLLLLILLTTKKDKEPHELNVSHTNQLKGLAILMVIFSHIGYFLDSGNSFLYPFSVAGGVGVNIFLFLSGFGLTLSALKSHHSVLGFYIKRLKRVYFPMWLFLTAVLLIDFFVLKVSYPTQTIVNSFIGYFPNAEIYDSINSPLWYFSFIVFYYLIFPLVFFKKNPLVSVLLVLLISLFVLKIELPVVPDVFKLYKLHFLAFPIGMFFAILESGRFKVSSLVKSTHPVLKIILSILLLASISYTAINSGVGERTMIEQFISLITMISFIFIVLLLPFKSGFLALLGIYSYEVYLIQWPILYRYDFIYKYLPAWISTLLYLALFLGISWVMKKIEGVILRPDKK